MNELCMQVLSRRDLVPLGDPLQTRALHPFATPEVVQWCYESSSGQEPLVVSVSSAFRTWTFALRLETVANGLRVARLYGHGLLDVMDCFTTSRVDDLDEDVLGQLLRFLQERFRISVLDLVGVQAESHLHDLIQHHQRFGGNALLSSQVCRRAVSRNVQQGGTHGGRTLRKRLRCAAQLGFQLRVPTGRNEKINVVQKLIEFHSLKWASKVTKEDRTLLDKFIVEWGMHPNVELPVLIDSTSSIASVLMIVKGQHWHHLYVQGYNPNFSVISPSRCAIALYIRHLLRDQPLVTGLDFMRGDEIYKHEFCDDSYELMRFTLGSVSVGAAQVQHVHLSFV